MIPKQSKDNPYNILADRVQWARFEYEAGRGDMYGLIDYAKRFNLMRDIEIEYGTSPAMLKTMAYLLNMGGECDV
jgi:hypothetical protein